MKIISATPYPKQKLVQVIAESRRGRRYECIADCRGAVSRTFRQEPSNYPGHELWVYVPVPPALRTAVRAAVLTGGR